MADTTVSPRAVAERQSAGEVVEILDVRTPAEYASVHVRGARLVPLDRLDPRAVMSSRAAAPGEAAGPVYLICRSGGRAAKAREKFVAAGFDDVLCIEGGTDAWERAGLPVDRGASRVISLERQVRIAVGTLVLVGVLLGWLVHPGFIALSAFVGAGLVFAGVTDWCGMGMLLARMPWNRIGPPDTASNPGSAAASPNPTPAQ